MKRKIGFYGNKSRLARFLLEKWCARNFHKYEVYLIFDKKIEFIDFNQINTAIFISLESEDLIGILLKNNIYDIFILDPGIILNLSYRKVEFKMNNINIYIENTEFLKNHFDKYLSFIILKEKKLPIPKFQLLSNFQKNPQLTYPIVVKPTRGYSSKGVVVVQTRNEFDTINNKIKEKDKYLVQEFVYGKEFSCTIIRNKTLLYMSIERLKLKEYTIKSKFIYDYNSHLSNWLPNFSNLDFEFALNIQYINTKLGPKIFELNPRLGTAETHRFEYYFDAIDLLLSTQNNLIKYKEGSFTLNP